MNDRWVLMFFFFNCCLLVFEVRNASKGGLCSDQAGCLYNQLGRIGIEAAVFGEKQKVPGLVLFRFV